MLTKYFPLRVFLWTWAVVFIIRLIGFLEYDSVTIPTLISIGAFLLLFFLGFILGVNKIVSIKRKISPARVRPDKYKSLLVLSKITFLLSAICISFMYLKMRGFSNNYGVDLSLKGFTDIRSANMTDSSYEIGSNIYGVISNMLFGFPVLAGLLAVSYNKVLSSIYVRSLYLCFVSGIIASFMTGGRIMAFTFILLFFFARKQKGTVFKRKHKVILVGVFVTLIVVSGQIFLDRIGERDISEVAYMLPKSTPKSWAYNLLKYSPNLVTVLIYFEYYIAHGINQLDVLLNAPTPISAPYLGAYQFSTFGVMFNKIGFSVVPPSQISDEIVNPGVYFTEIGAMYLDFGYALSCLLTLLFSFACGQSWIRYIKKRRFSNLFQNSIFLSLTIMSSIISLVGSGYFAAILLSAFFVIIFEKQFGMPKIT